MADDSKQPTPALITPGRPKVPTLPPTRTFTVRRPDKIVSTNPAENVAVFEAMEGHQVEITAHGDLLVFEFSFSVTEDGYEPRTQLRRAFATGQWLDLNEVMRTASKLIYN